MEKQKNPPIDEIIIEIRRLCYRFSDIEHQLIQKDIQIATLEQELGLQKKFYSLLRESYLKILHPKN